MHILKCTFLAIVVSAPCSNPRVLYIHSNIYTPVLRAMLPNSRKKITILKRTLNS